MHSRRYALLLCLLLDTIALSVPLATAGPFDAWSYRTPVQLNNAAGTASLLDFPVLVRLDSGSFDFGKAAPNGADLRFASSGGSALSYEIEKWDPVAGTAAVWVKVPQIDLGSTTGFISMYTGNTAATDDQDAAGVWSSGYVNVWHLGASLKEARRNASNAGARGV